MTCHQILVALKKSSRWGCNAQPDIEWFSELLFRFKNNLIDVDVQMDDGQGDTCTLTFIDNITLSQAFDFIGVNADEYEWDEKKRTLMLWWD
jgi:hypothetical protein